MPSLGDIITKDTILLDYQSSSPELVLQAISALAAEMSGLRAATVYQRLSERFSEGVGVGAGVAIPHARFEGLKRPLGFYVTLRSPLVFGAAENPTVDTLFVLLAPEQANAAHLKVLAQVARLLRTPETREQLRAAVSKELVFDLFTAAA
jgi:nitrogen PTS system EIIA component